MQESSAGYDGCSGRIRGTDVLIANTASEDAAALEVVEKRRAPGQLNGQLESANAGAREGIGRVLTASGPRERE